MFGAIPEVSCSRFPVHRIGSIGHMKWSIHEFRHAYWPFLPSQHLQPLTGPKLLFMQLFSKVYNSAKSEQMVHENLRSTSQGKSSCWKLTSCSHPFMRKYCLKRGGNHLFLALDCSRNCIYDISLMFIFRDWQNLHSISKSVKQATQKRVKVDANSFGVALVAGWCWKFAENPPITRWDPTMLGENLLAFKSPGNNTQCQVVIHNGAVTISPQCWIAINIF